MAGGENTSGLFLCPVLGGRYALGGVHSKISMTPFKFADYQELNGGKDMTRVFIWKITAHRNGRKSVFQRSVRHAAMVALLGAFFVENSQNVP